MYIAAVLALPCHLAMAHQPEGDGLAARAEETGQLLVRSGIEIGHTLEAMRAAGDTLSADFALEEHLFVTRLLKVDAQNGTMTIAERVVRSQCSSHGKAVSRVHHQP